MKTRMELWKNYRATLESNVELQKTLNKSTESLIKITDEIHRYIPGYKEKYRMDLFNSSIDLSQKEYSYKKPDHSELDNLISDFKAVQESAVNNPVNRDFSSHNLDKVVDTLKGTDIKLNTNKGSMNIQRTKFVELEEKNE